MILGASSIPRICAWLAILIGLAGCRSTPVQVAGGEIRNRTAEPVLAVQAAHSPGGRAVYTNQILPGSRLRMGLAPRELRARSVTLTWKTARGRDCSATLEVGGPPGELAEGPVWVVYSIVGVDRVTLTWERPPY